MDFMFILFLFVCHFSYFFYYFVVWFCFCKNSIGTIEYLIYFSFCLIILSYVFCFVFFCQLNISFCFFFYFCFMEEFEMPLSCYFLYFFYFLIYFYFFLLISLKGLWFLWLILNPWFERKKKINEYLRIFLVFLFVFRLTILKIRIISLNFGNFVFSVRWKLNFFFFLHFLTFEKRFPSTF